MSINPRTFLTQTLKTQHSAQPLPLVSFLGPKEKASLRSTSLSFQSLFPEQTPATVMTFRGGIEAISKIEAEIDEHIILKINPSKEVFAKQSKILLANREQINLPLKTWFSRNGSIVHCCAKVSFTTQLIPILAQCGADFSLREQNLFKNTPLLQAIANACNGNAMQIIKLAPVEALNSQSIVKGILDNSPLHLVIGKGYGRYSADFEVLPYSNVELAEELIDRGVDVNVRNRLGNTPLHMACIRRDFSMIRYLLAHGAKTDIANNEGKSAKDLLSLSFGQAYHSLEDQVRIFSSF